MRQQWLEACAPVLGHDTIYGLLALELDDEDLLMAIYAELNNAGVPDPEDYLRAKGVLE